MRSVDESEVRYTHAGDVDIAWTVTGSGPTDIVYVPGFISHLDLARELPVFDAVIGRLGRLGRVLTFDKRGTGLSGRESWIWQPCRTCGRHPRGDGRRRMGTCASSRDLRGRTAFPALRGIVSGSASTASYSTGHSLASSLRTTQQAPISTCRDFFNMSNVSGGRASFSEPSSMHHPPRRSSNNLDGTNVPVHRHVSSSRSCDRIWQSMPGPYCQRFPRLRSSYTAPTIRSWASPVGVQLPQRFPTHISSSLQAKCIVGGTPANGPPARRNGGISSPVRRLRIATSIGYWPRFFSRTSSSRRKLLLRLVTIYGMTSSIVTILRLVGS